MTTINITVHPNDASKIEALVAFMKALKIKYEVKKTEEPYNEAFVKIVLDAEQEIKKGKVTKVSSNDFDNLWK